MADVLDKLGELKVMGALDFANQDKLRPPPVIVVKSLIRDGIVNYLKEVRPHGLLVGFAPILILFHNICSFDQY
jgi:hypothetical protein